MNLWGYTPGFLKELEARFPAFLDKALVENPIKGEFFLPLAVSQLIGEKKATVTVLNSPDKWYGVTYACLLYTSAAWPAARPRAGWRKSPECTFPRCPARRVR